MSASIGAPASPAASAPTLPPPRHAAAKPHDTGPSAGVAPSAPPQSAAAVQPVAQASSAEALGDMAQKANEALSKVDPPLSMRFDLDGGKLRSIQLVNPDTDEVIVQVPSEAALRVTDNIAKALDRLDAQRAAAAHQALSGVFVDTKA